MNKIRILPLHEIKKIAAGEVVERPANIVKELVENSLDAGAKQISIYVEDGGKKLIRVIDDGCGMSFEDAICAFDPHATSKITSVADLEKIVSFGFRGEALSSISSIGEVTLKTKEISEASGTLVFLKYGELEKHEEVACSDGTDITLYNLFENIPARKKFLKVAETEWRHILLLYQAFVLAYKDVHFKLFHEERLVYNCPPVESVSVRALQLWNQQLADHLLSISCEDGASQFKLSGFISNHQYARFNTAQIFFFVNGRWIRNQSLMKSLLKGYSNVYQQGKYPAAFIFIETDASLIDVNIHPRKEEVRFIYVHKIEQLLQKCVHDCLNQQVSDELQKAVSYTATREHSVFGVYKPVSSTIMNNTYKDSEDIDDHLGLVDRPSLSIQTTTSSNYSVPKIVELPHYRLIGQLHQSYILLEKEDGFLMIDQHAAHERILYELFKNRFTQIETIQLLFPQQIELLPDEIQLLINHNQLLAKHGIVGDQMGERNFVIKSVPIFLKNADLISLTREIIGAIQELCTLSRDEFTQLLTDKIHAQMACKAAVKAGDQLSYEKMQEIITQLETTENRLTCPHGRPTVWFMSLTEIEKKFRRDYVR